MEYEALMALAKRRYDELTAADASDKADRHYRFAQQGASKRVRRGAPKTPRRATCHPEQPHYATGLCAACYAVRRKEKKRSRALDNPESARSLARRNAKYAPRTCARCEREFTPTGPGAKYCHRADCRKVGT